jgi:TatD DNase family protein
MIDSHCHLDLSAFDDDLPDVLQRALDAGVKRFHIPGTTQLGWSKQQVLASKYTYIDYSLGLHPYFLQPSWEDHFKALQTLAAQDNQYLAIGEIGLDGVVDVAHDIQRKACENQLLLAMELKLPVVMHHRKTHHELLALLNKTRFSQGGVIHAFTGSPEVAKAYIDRGFLLGVGGTITYERSNKTRKALASVPLTSLVLETDSPDMPIHSYQGQRNEPNRLPHVAKALAGILALDEDEICRITSGNYERVFGLSRRTLLNP